MPAWCSMNATICGARCTLCGCAILPNLATLKSCFLIWLPEPMSPELARSWLPLLWDASLSQSVQRG